jgi:hypothetical protein
MYILQVFKKKLKEQISIAMVQQVDSRYIITEYFPILISTKS